MPSVKDILAEKGSQVLSIPAAATVLEATQKMNQHQVGALVITEDGRAVGIFTERDVLRRVVAEERLPANTRVGEVMTREVICVPVGADVDEVGAIMKNKRIRHVPVCAEDGRVVGMVSIGDVNAWRASNQESTIMFLSDYIYGRV